MNMPLSRDFCLRGGACHHAVNTSTDKSDMPSGENWSYSSQLALPRPYPKRGLIQGCQGLVERGREWLAELEKKVTRLGREAAKALWTQH
jgi:hypothetical protein